METVLLDDHIPSEKEPILTFESHDGIPLDCIALELEGIAKGPTMTPMTNGHSPGGKHRHGIHDELFACFDEWTQRLSEVHQTQLDEACQKIIRELTEVHPNVVRLQPFTSPPQQRQKEEELQQSHVGTSRSTATCQSATQSMVMPQRLSYVRMSREAGQSQIHSLGVMIDRRSRVDKPDPTRLGEAIDRRSVRCSQAPANQASRGTMMSRKSFAVHVGFGSNPVDRCAAEAEILQQSWAKGPRAFVAGPRTTCISHREPATGRVTQVGQTGAQRSKSGVLLPQRAWWDSVLPRRTRRTKSFGNLADGKPPNKFEKIVTSKGFDIMSAFIIVAFLVVLGVETDHMSQHSGESSSANFAISMTFNIWFTVELLLRIAAERKLYFYSDDWMINVTDCFLVLNSIVEVIMASMTGAQTKSLENLRVGRILRIIRIMRIIRIVRLVRALRYFYQFRKMVCLIQGCFTTLFWVLLIMTTIVYTFAVFFTQGATDHLFPNGVPGEVPDDTAIRKYYGSVGMTMRSLFMSMSGGIDWADIFRPLGALGWVYSVAFLFFITSSLFGVLNVITSVFVESTMKSALAYRDLIITDNEKTKQVALEHLRDLFVEIDEDGDGEVTVEEMMVFLQDPNIHMYMQALDIHPEDARALFLMLDNDQSGRVDIDEFCDGCLKLKGEAKSFDVHCLMCEIGKFFKRWSNFTEYTTRRFDAVEAWCQALQKLQMDTFGRQDNAVMRLQQAMVAELQASQWASRSNVRSSKGRSSRVKL